MPTYGTAKKRDMARSILPSTKRNGQEDRRRVHKSARTHERALMGFAEPEWWDEEVDDIMPPDFAGVERKRAHDIKDMVDLRRHKDKVGPFSRWAERVTKNIPHVNRLSYLRSLVPDTLIGEHAVSHVEWKDHFRDPAKSANNHRHYPSPKEQGQTERDRLVEQVRACLLEQGEHARLNRALKQSHRLVYHYYKGHVRLVGPKSARTLQGAHDVEAFVDAIHAAAWPTLTVVRDKRLDPARHTRVQSGPDTGAFLLPSPEYHPEWVGTLRAFFHGLDPQPK
jgi:hypothetical protein